MRNLGAIASALLAAACAHHELADGGRNEITLSLEPYTFIASDGARIEAERGVFEVPEHRGDPDSRTIRLSFVRFPSTSPTPGDPVVYLAGGPGGSGVAAARGDRFPIFMKMREVADVIAFDQRGTGLSNEVPACEPRNPEPLKTLTRETLVAFYRNELTQCFAWWDAQGVAIDGYTTLESAHDIEDLRRVLKADRLNLWGISYGSHLGLAVLKHHPQSVGRAVFAGVEGLNETIKRPALSDAYFQRMQTQLDRDPKVRAAFPDLAGLMRRVHTRLDATPAQTAFTPRGGGEQVSITFDGFAVQLLTSATIADPGDFARIPMLYLALDNGRYDLAATFLHQALRDQTARFRGMPEAMDLASGITGERLLQVQKEAQTAILGDALNFPMPHILGIRPAIDLGDGFRADFTSSAPVLLISGTLDGRTYPEAAERRLKSLSQGEILVVENGGHNIFEADERVAAAVVNFFLNEPTPRRIVMDPPTFATP